MSLFDLSEHTRSSSPDSLFRNDYGYDNEDGGDESFQSPHFQLGTSPEVEHSLENDSHNNSSSFAQSIMPETEANFATSPAADTPVNSSMSETTQRWTQTHPNWRKERWGMDQYLNYNRSQISTNEIQKLDTGQCLNDELINFYLQWLKRIPAASSICIHNSYLYTDYLKKSESRKGRWGDWEAAEWMLIPIHQDGHWFLILVGNLASLGSPPVTGSTRPVCLMIIDSMENSGHKDVVKHVQDYLCLKAVDKFNLLHPISPEIFQQKRTAGVLNQHNLFDCGIFLLEHAERFVNDPAGFFAQVQHSPLEQNLDAERKRVEIRELIFQMKKAKDEEALQIHAEIQSHIPEGVNRNTGNSDGQNSTDSPIQTQPVAEIAEGRNISLDVEENLSQRYISFSLYLSLGLL